jgi:hypothetical protein
VFEHFEYFDLAHGSFFDDLILLGLFKLFDGDHLPIVIALALEDNTIGSLAYHAHNIILLHLIFITITPLYSPKPF